MTYTLQLSLLTIGLSLSSITAAACPDWLNTERRQLHSDNQVDLCSLTENKPVLIINTASRCGFTPQFKGLEQLHQQYADQGLVVLGFPSNDFRQEARDEQKTAQVCYINYGVTFTMLAPVQVTGEQADPIFAQLARVSQAPRWNFNKYLVSADGQRIQHFSSSTKPNDPQLIGAIEQALE